MHALVRIKSDLKKLENHRVQLEHKKKKIMHLHHVIEQHRRQVEHQLHETSMKIEQRKRLGRRVVQEINRRRRLLRLVR